MNQIVSGLFATTMGTRIHPRLLDAFHVIAIGMPRT